MSTTDEGRTVERRFLDAVIELAPLANKAIEQSQHDGFMGLQSGRITAILWQLNELAAESQREGEARARLMKMAAEVRREGPKFGIR